MKRIHYSLFLAVAMLVSCGSKPNEEPQYWSQIAHFQESDQPDSLLAAIAMQNAATVSSSVVYRSSYQ